MKKVRLSIGLLVALALVFTACSSAAQPQAAESASSEESSTEPEQKTYKIAYSCLLLTHNYFAALVQGMEDEAAEMGNVELTVFDANLDATKQLNALEDMIVQGYDGIIISPVDSQQLVDAVDKAKEKGIWIMSQAQGISNADLNIILDEYDYGYEGGKLAGQWIVDELDGTAEVGILTTGNVKDLVERAQGLQDGILLIAPGAEIVSVQPGNTLELGVKAAETILQANPDVRVIAAVTDAGALGAIEAIAAANKATEDFYVGGLDATDEAKAKMVEPNSILRATVDIEPYENGRQCVREMVNMIENGAPTESTILIGMSPLTQADLLK